MINERKAFWLCLFLGWCGVHRFYERKIWTGILYLCTAGLWCIGWFFDLWLLYIKPNKPITESYQYHNYLKATEVLQENGYTVSEYKNEWCEIAASIYHDSAKCGTIFVVADPSPDFISKMIGSIFPGYIKYRYDFTECGFWERRFEVKKIKYERNDCDYNSYHYWNENSFVAGIADAAPYASSCEPIDDNKWLSLLESVITQEMLDGKSGTKMDQKRREEMELKLRKDVRRNEQEKQTEKKRPAFMTIFTVLGVILIPLALFYTWNKNAERIKKQGHAITTIPGSFTDSRDGKTYKTIKIGTQTWLAENLNYNLKGSKCYDDELANCDIYGRHYNWNAAMKACPKGWHLPGNAEWDKLYRYADGTNGTDSPYESPNAGKHLKAKSDWNDFNGNSGNGLDSYGFTALPGGSQYSNTFHLAGENGYWWTASESDEDNAYYRFMLSESGRAGWNNKTKSLLLNVRCVH